MVTVLYVEDAFDDRESMLRAVAKAKPNFKLRLAEDCRGPIEYLSNQGLYEDQGQFPLPDLVLLDYSLKGCKAPELLTWIRANPQTATLPVVILSANTVDDVVTECYACGANYFIEKRADPNEWLALVRALDACFSTAPVELKPLQKLAVRPELAREHSKASRGKNPAGDLAARGDRATRSGSGRAKGKQAAGRVTQLSATNLEAAANRSLTNRNQGSNMLPWSPE